MPLLLAQSANAYFLPLSKTTNIRVIFALSIPTPPSPRLTLVEEGHYHHTASILHQPFARQALNGFPPLSRVGRPNFFFSETKREEGKRQGKKDRLIAGYRCLRSSPRKKTNTAPEGAAKIEG